MDYIQLSRISFKHLTVLHVLLATHSVTHTAQQLCVSPSSVSKTLNQLRDLLGDELFYRDGARLVPTAYAIKTGPAIHALLSSMNGVLHQQDFEPLRYRGSFSFSMRSSAFEVFAADIAAIVTEKAPNARVNIYSKEQMGLDGLLRGQVDFVLLPHDISQPPTDNRELTWQVLKPDAMVCLMSASHPLATQEISVEAYLACRHVGILEKELNTPYFEQNLIQHHGTRDIAVSVADFGSAAMMCHHSDLLFTTSKLWAETALQAKGLVTKPLPFDYGEVAYSLVWNRPALNDPAMQWIYQQLTG